MSPSAVVDRAHPLGVAAGEVVVDGDDVDALAGERVEARPASVAGERLALAGLHLGDVAAVEDHAADELHVEVAHAHRAPPGLADEREASRAGGRRACSPSCARARAARRSARAAPRRTVELELGLEARRSRRRASRTGGTAWTRRCSAHGRGGPCVERSSGGVNSRAVRPMVPGVRIKVPFARESGPAPGVVSVRQAVCDASRAVIGYEVLTGDPDAPPASARFCARALLEAFTDVDLDLVAPHHPAYLTVAPALLLRLDMLPVAPDRVVLQIETATTVHEEVVAAVSRLAGLRLRLRRRRSAVARRRCRTCPRSGSCGSTWPSIDPVAVGRRVVRPFLAAGLRGARRGRRVLPGLRGLRRCRLPRLPGPLPRPARARPGARRRARRDGHRRRAARARPRQRAPRGAHRPRPRAQLPPAALRQLRLLHAPARDRHRPRGDHAHRRAHDAPLGARRRPRRRRPAPRRAAHRRARARAHDGARRRRPARARAPTTPSRSASSRCCRRSSTGRWSRPSAASASPPTSRTRCSTAARPTARCSTAWSATSTGRSSAARAPRASIASTRPTAPRWRGSSRCARKSSAAPSPRLAPRRAAHCPAVRR